MRSVQSTATTSRDGEQKAKHANLRNVDEGRKRVLLIAAAILAARRLIDWDGRPSPRFESAIHDAIVVAERIMDKIDSRWPTRK